MINAIITDGTLIDTNDSRLSDARTPTAHTHSVVDLSDSTTAGRALITAADAAAQRTLLNVQDGATADQSDAEIETAYNNQVSVVSQAEAEAGSATTARRWTAERVKQSVVANAVQVSEIDTLAKVNGIITDATLIDTTDSRLSDARTPTAHTHTASDISDSTAAGRTLFTAADAAAQRTALNVEDGATAPTTLNVETDAATITFDLSESDMHEVELEGNRTLALSNVPSGRPFYVRLAQDEIGSRTVTWWSGITWGEGGTVPALTVTADKADAFMFLCRSAGVYDGYIVNQDI